MTYIQGQVPNKSESETFIILYRSWGVPIHTGKHQNMATCHGHGGPLATCPTSLKPLSEVNSVTFSHLHSRIPFIYCDMTSETIIYHCPVFPMQNLCQRSSFSVLWSTFFSLFVLFLPPYGFLLFSFLVIFLLQICPISLFPGVVQVLSYQAIVGSQPILLNILEKTESFLLFGAHHSSSVSAAFWWGNTGHISHNY